MGDGVPCYGALEIVGLLLLLLLTYRSYCWGAQQLYQYLLVLLLLVFNH